MTMAFRFRKYVVRLYREVGGPHHRPHAHIEHGKSRIASVYLETLDVYDVIERLPRNLMDELRSRQEALIALWIELNEND
jgi:hypothetical protein